MVFRFVFGPPALWDRLTAWVRTAPEPAVQPAHAAHLRAIKAAGVRASLCCSRIPETDSSLFLPFLDIRWRVKHLGCLKPGPRAL